MCLSLIPWNDPLPPTFGELLVLEALNPIIEHSTFNENRGCTHYWHQTYKRYTNEHKDSRRLCLWPFQRENACCRKEQKCNYAHYICWCCPQKYRIDMYKAVFTSKLWFVPGSAVYTRLVVCFALNDKETVLPQAMTILHCTRSASHLRASWSSIIL
jgi:hypothetical protein